MAGPRPSRRAMELTMAHPVLPPMLCVHCGACSVPIIGPGTGPHVARAQCSGCGRYLKWLPKALLSVEKDVPRMDSVNLLIVSGCLDRAPMVRFREDGTCVCTGTMRLEESGTQGAVFKTYVPFEAYGKVGEQIGEWQAGDLGLLQGKVFWRKYHTKSSEEKSGLALLVQKGTTLAPTPALSGTTGQHDR
jgi:hypothetical protein